MKGRRRPDSILCEFPDDIQPGDYWKILNNDGSDMKSGEPSNLTGTCWFVLAPKPDGEGYAIGKLTKHTVREEDDGTISIRPGDGSSNSVLIYDSRDFSWHGYIEHGEWKEC